MLTHDRSMWIGSKRLFLMISIYKVLEKVCLKIISKKVANNVYSGFLRGKM